MMNKLSDGAYSSSVRSDEDAIGAESRQWQLAYREALAPRIFRTVLILIGLFLATFTVTGPMGTHDLTWTQRLTYFSMVAALCKPFCYANYVVVLYLTRYWPPFRIAVAVAGGMLVASLPSTIIVYAIDTLIRTQVPSYGLPKMYLFVASSMLLCSFLTHYMVGQRLGNGPAASPSIAPAGEHILPGSADGRTFSSAAADHAVMEPPSRFLDRLPPVAGRDIIYLRMSDHYVEVVTTVGRCTVLMRFADAVAELGDHGIRVHRSYWVAHRHLNGWTRRNQRTELRLTGNHLVPVSRPYLSDVRAAVARDRVGVDATGRTPTEDGSRHA